MGGGGWVEVHTCLMMLLTCLMGSPMYLDWMIGFRRLLPRTSNTIHTSEIFIRVKDKF